jgi:hypothetical protein
MADFYADKLFHITFTTPVRVMLMDRSTPMVAVTGHFIRVDGLPGDVVMIKVKMLFPAQGNPVRGSLTITTLTTNVAGVVEVAKE